MSCLSIHEYKILAFASTYSLDSMEKRKKLKIKSKGWNRPKCWGVKTKSCAKKWAISEAALMSMEPICKEFTAIEADAA